MPSRPHVAVWGIVPLVAILLVGLSALQYHWLGDLSELEERRMRANLEEDTDDFQDDLDRELANLYEAFEIDGRRSADLIDELARRHEEWSRDASFPALLASIHWIDVEGVRDDAAWSTPLRFDVAERRLVPSPWPAGLESLGVALERASRSLARSGRRSWRREVDPLIEDVPAIVIYQDEIRARSWTVLRLDRDVLLNELVPARAEEHFGGSSGLDFYVWIVDLDDPSRAVWASHPDLGPPPASEADATEPVFSLSWAFRGDRGDAADHRWRLIVEHQAGSLEAAVGAVRRRNLLLGFGITLLLGASVVVLFVGSRRAHALAEQQMEFVAGVSHELRTPIAGISSLSSNLADGVVDERSQTRRYGRAIHRQSQRLAEMVENVLLFATGGNRKSYAAQPLDVVGVVREAIDAVEAAAVDRSGAASEPPAAPRIRLSADGSLPRVEGDARALRSAVVNLLSNAVKFGPAGGAIDVQVRWGRSDGDGVRISVADEGPGIPRSEMRRILEPFYRGRDARNRQIEGCGLGLSLVQRVVDAHGGRVEIDSGPERGSRFTIVLPSDRSSAGGDPTRTGGDARGAGDDAP